VRADMLYTRARLALAVARQEGRPGLLRLAAADGRALIGLHMPWTVALGKLVLAGVASFQNRSEALRLLLAAEPEFVAADMRIHAAVTRARRGELIGGSEGQALVGGSEGQALVVAALADARTLGAQRPEGFLPLLAPCVL
jgi:eukaryotic-like serine/threonine-protein kinase